MFSKSSRYYNLGDRTWTSPDGREVVYKERRLIPRFGGAIAGRTTVAQSERLDLVAVRTVGRPESFWKLADANDALDPFDLVEPSGRTLRVPEI